MRRIIFIQEFLKRQISFAYKEVVQYMDLRKKRQEEIIQAAMNVFSKNGFEGSKMEVIAAEAGIGKGTIYGYFSSKRELFEEMICYNIDKYKKELSKIVAGQQSFSEKLERLFQYHAGFLDQNLDIFQITSTGKLLSHSMKKRLIKEQESFFELIEEMLKKGISSGEIRKNIDQEIAVLCILGAINQFAGKRIFMDKVSVDSIDSAPLIDILMGGLVDGGIGNMDL